MESCCAATISCATARVAIALPADEGARIDVDDMAEWSQAPDDTVSCQKIGVQIAQDRVQGNVIRCDIVAYQTAYSLFDVHPLLRRQ